MWELVARCGRDDLASGRAGTLARWHAGTLVGLEAGGEVERRRGGEEEVRLYWVRPRARSDFLAGSFCCALVFGFSS